MKTVAATEVKNHFGQYLDLAHSEPIVVKKIGRPVAVIIPIEKYNSLIKLEDEYWGQKALKAEKQGFVGEKESLKFIKSKM